VPFCCFDTELESLVPDSMHTLQLPFRARKVCVHMHICNPIHPHAAVQVFAYRYSPLRTRAHKLTRHMVAFPAVAAARLGQQGSDWLACEVPHAATHVAACLQEVLLEVVRGAPARRPAGVQRETCVCDVRACVRVHVCVRVSVCARAHVCVCVGVMRGNG
jgi:hypothetical protein